MCIILFYQVFNSNGLTVFLLYLSLPDVDTILGNTTHGRFVNLLSGAVDRMATTSFPGKCRWTVSWQGQCQCGVVCVQHKHNYSVGIQQDTRSEHVHEWSVPAHVGWPGLGSLPLDARHARMGQRPGCNGGIALVNAVCRQRNQWRNLPGMKTLLNMIDMISSYNICSLNHAQCCFNKMNRSYAY